MSNAVLHTEVAGAELALLASGAVYLPLERALLVADVHLGKAWAFRRLGIPVPEATTGETLERLADALAHTGARQLFFLGDLLHARRGRSARLFAQLQAWRERHAQVAVRLVRGNHDARAGDPPAELGIAVADEPVRLGPFALCHHPQPVDGAYVLAGHWHPCVHVGRGFDRMRLPCFWLGGARRVGVLPAFGSFTGMHPIDPDAGDRVYAIAGDTVRCVTALCGGLALATRPG